MSILLKFIFKKYKSFFVNEFLSEPPKLTDAKEITKIYQDNKSLFEELLVQDFIGHIPKEINEPALRALSHDPESLEKWLLWHSYYVNRKVVRDPERIQFYDGIMVYLKVFLTIARTNKTVSKMENTVSRETSSMNTLKWVDEALSGVKAFKKGYENKNSKTKEAEESETQPSKNEDSINEK